MFQTPLDCITPSSTTSSIRTLSKATPVISSFNDPLHSALTTTRTINNNSNIHSDEEDNLNDLTEEELRAILDSDNEKEN
ncbi:hypothetical protein ABK040_003545 [Willaertia magna]